MSLLRKARSELSGAVRSVRYDLGRRPVEPPPGGPDVTSTGMSTFGGHLFEEPPVPHVPVSHAAPSRRPRRAAAVTVFGVLTVVGATGAYLGVVNGLGSLLDETPAAAGTFPPPPAATVTFTPNSGIGRGPAATGPRTTPPAVADAVPGPAAPPVAALPGQIAANDPAGNASPMRTVPGAAKPESAGNPPPLPVPVPTPTAPASSSSPSPSASPSDSAGPTGPGSPDPGETSATPNDSAEPSDSPHARHRRYHR